VYADSDVSSGGEPEGGGNTFGVDMYTDGPIAPGVLDLSWRGEVIDGEGCCFSGSFGGTVWDLETGTPVPVYSWSSPGFFGAGGVTLPFKLGIPFSVSVSASVGGAGEGFAELGSTAVVSVHGTPEPGTFALMLAALAATGVLKTRRTRRI
jgi:hypothetical protein